MRQQTKSSLVQIMACHLFVAKPSSEPFLNKPWQKLQFVENRNQNEAFEIKKKNMQDDEFETTVYKMVAILSISV